MCSLASQTCRRTGLLNCCHGIGTIRTCRWSLELGIMLYAIRGPRRVLSLELMVYRVKELPRQWLRVASVVLPSVILSPMWVFAVSAEIAAWRLQEEGHHPPEHFDPLWKLLYMWEHPYHFPLAAWRVLSGWGALHNNGRLHRKSIRCTRNQIPTLRPR